MLNWVLFPPSACSVISLTLCQCPCPCLLCLIVFITKESLLILWNNYTTSFSQVWLAPVWFRRKKKCEREGRGEELTEEESESDEEECQHLLSRSLTSLYTSPTPLGQISPLPSTSLSLAILQASNQVNYFSLKVLLPLRSTHEVGIF